MKWCLDCLDWPIPVVFRGLPYGVSWEVMSWVKFSFVALGDHLECLHCGYLLSPSLSQAKTEAEVLLEREGLSQERVWVVHKGGFCLGTIVQDSPKKSTLATHTSFFRVQVRPVESL